MNDAEQLVATVERFCKFIAALPDSTLPKQDWGPREVLAHLVFHHERYVRLAQAFLAGNPEIPYNGRYREMNARAVAENRGIPVLVLLERLRAANERLLAIYHQNDPGKIPMELKAGAKMHTLAVLIPLVEAHIRNHQEKLSKEIKPRNRQSQEQNP